MKKRLFLILTILLLIPTLVLASINVDFQRLGEKPPRLVDEADLLDDSREEMILDRLNRVSKELNFDIVIYTNNSLGYKTATEFADDYFDYNSFGMGPNRDGVLLIISMDERDYAISTSGYGITAFTDYGIKKLEDELVDYLAAGDYFSAFDYFIDTSEFYVSEAKAGRVIDRGSRKIGLDEYGIMALVSLVGAAAISFGYVKILESTHISKKRKYNANTYKNGVVNIIPTRDMFLNRNITRVRRPRESSNSGGGSTTHTSSSGRTHGGSSGKF